MNAKAALCKALLNGHVLNVRNCFALIGYTNCSREISRMVEKPFGVTVSRTPRKGKSRYGGSVAWVDFRLNNVPYNYEGIKKMKEYVNKQLAAV